MLTYYNGCDGLNLTLFINNSPISELMYAIVNIAGVQMKVQLNDALYTQKLNNAVGDSVTFEQVLLIEADEKAIFGRYRTLWRVRTYVGWLEHEIGVSNGVFKPK